MTIEQLEYWVTELESRIKDLEEAENERRENYVLNAGDEVFEHARKALKTLGLDGNSHLIPIKPVDD